MPTTVRWNTSARVTLDALGAGTVTISGPKPGQNIQVTRAVVTCPATRKIPKFTYYLGSPFDPNTISTSSTGHRDTDSNPNIIMAPGDFITAVWTGGDAGAVASIVLYGVLEYH